MNNRFYKWLNLKYPQSYIIKNPYTGALILALFCFIFVTLYRPLNTHPSKTFSFKETMALYCFVVFLSVIFSVKLLKIFKYFSNSENWTFLKELISTLLVLFVIGINIFFIGFFIEPTAPRWNISTFLDSCKNAFLVGIIPFSFFNVINYRYFFYREGKFIEDSNANETGLEKKTFEKEIQIKSKLKKEELRFCPSQFLYAESDGNYVVFYINKDNIISKKTIRNSISSIEQQLSSIPYCFRTHRAFIVNMKKVTKKRGNMLGYRLKLEGIDFEIPVSRQNIRKFDKLFKQSSYNLFSFHHKKLPFITL